MSVQRYSLEEYEGGESLLCNENGRFVFYEDHSALERVADDMAEALKTARPQMAHVPDCIVVNPTVELGRMGSTSAANCNCAIKQVDAALASYERLKGQ